jgi:hypothetical protein
MDRLESGLQQRIETASRVYADFYAELQRTRIGALDAMVAPDMLFRDPVQEFRGRDKFKALFERMYEAFANPAFVVHNRALDGQVCFLKWTFTGAMGKRTFAVIGVSEVEFDNAGLVVTHVDHWDAASQFYEHFPLLGGVLRLIKNRVKH